MTAAAVHLQAGLPRDALGTWLFLGAVWVASATLAGLGLAAFARRLHPGLSFVRLWVFYSALTAFLAAVVFLVGVF